MSLLWLFLAIWAFTLAGVYATATVVSLLRANVIGTMSAAYYVFRSLLVAVLVWGGIALLTLTR